MPESHLLLMQKDQALGHIQCHSATLLVPAEGANAVGIAVLQYTRLQVPALHILTAQHSHQSEDDGKTRCSPVLELHSGHSQYQHGAGGIQTRAVQLHHVAIVRQLMHQMDLLHEVQAILKVIGVFQIWTKIKLAVGEGLRMTLPHRAHPDHIG